MKRSIAILIATIMVLTLLPMTGAVSASTGELTVAGDGLAITAIDGGSSEDATAKLTDGVTFNYGQAIFRHKTAGVSDYWYNSSKNAAYVYAFANNTNDKILEFNWTSGKAVRRVDLWIGDNKPFTAYEIQISDGNGGWTKHAEGTLIGNMNTTRQCNYEPILFDPIPATSTALRVVMKNPVAAIYIGEARISTDNDYNMLAWGANEALCDTDAFTYFDEAVGTSYQASKRYSGVVATHCLVSGFSAADSGSGYYFNTNAMAREFNIVWPAHLNLLDKVNLTANANGDCWYAATFTGRFFDGHAVKVNRIKVKVAAGSAEGFDVYYTTNGEVFEALEDNTGAKQYLDANVSAWTKAASYNCREGYPMEANNSLYYELEIPDAPAGGQWMVHMKDPSADIEISDIQFHLVDEDEFQPVTKAAQKVFDAINGGEALVEGDTLTLPETQTIDGVEYDVVYTSNSANIDVATGAVTHGLQNQKVIISAVVSPVGNPYSFAQANKEFTVSGSMPVIEGGLTPEENGLTIKAIGGKVNNAGAEGQTGDAGVDATAVLTDGITLNLAQAGSAYQAGKPWGVAGADYASYMLKFVHNGDTPKDGILEFNWTGGQPIRRIDVWVTKTDCFKEYEIQIPDGNGGWTKHAEGRVTYGSGDNSRQTTYHALLFDPIPADSTSVRLVMKNNTADIIVAEARISATNEYNLIDFSVNEDIITNDGKFNYYNSESSWSAIQWYSGNIATHGLFSGETARSANGRNLNVSAMVRSFLLLWPAELNKSDKHNIIPNPNGDCWYAVSFAGRFENGQEVAVNRVRIYLDAGTADGFEVYKTNTEGSFNGLMTANNGDNCPDANVDQWEKVATYPGSMGTSSSATLDIAETNKASYWLVRLINPSANVQMSKVEFHQVSEDEFTPTTKAAKKALDVVDTGVVVAGNMNFPAQQTIDGILYDVTYECDSPNVNTTTGEVTHTFEEQEVVVKANINPAGNPYECAQAEKTFTISANDTRERVVLVNEAFAGTVDETFKSATGSVAIADNKATIGNGSASYELALPNGFDCTIKNALEIGLDAGSVGTISVKGSIGTMAELVIGANDITVVGGGLSNKLIEATGIEKIKLEFVGDAFNVSLDTGDGYVMAVYKEPTMTENDFAKEIVFAGTSSTNVVVNELKNSVVSVELFEMVYNALSVANFSTSPSAAISEDLIMMDPVGDVTFSYASSDAAVIDPVTGAVDTTNRIPITYTVTVLSPNAASRDKAFVLIPAEENHFGGAIVSAPGTRVANIADNELTTKWVVDNNGNPMTVTLDLGTEKYFNEVLIFSDGTQPSSVAEYVLSVSDKEDVDDAYEVVQSGTCTEDFNLIKLDEVVSGRYVRVRFVPDGQDAIGVLELAGYLVLSDEEICEHDRVRMEETYQANKSTTIAKTGFFGSAITVESDSEYINITSSGDNWEITVTDPSQETVAHVTVTFTSGSATKTHVFEAVLLGTTHIRDNRPDGGSPSKKDDGPVKEPNRFDNIPHNDVYDEAKKDELDGHWGAAEIRSLVEKGIVQGDGASLNLTGQVKRGEFLKMMLAAFGYEPTEYTGAFEDVSADKWYAGYAETAKANGIMAGDGINFRGEDTISRQEMAVVLMNLLKQKGISVENAEAAIFTDNNTISAWAGESVGAAVKLGLLKGYEDGTFMPKKELRRDEAMIVVYRALACVETAEGVVAE